MYVIYALLGALMASLSAIFAKAGLRGVDSGLLTAIRGVVMALIVSLAALYLGKLSFTALQNLSSKQWIFISLSGLGGALSWIFFFHALSLGPVVSVTVIDKFSVVFTAILAVVVLSEGMTLSSAIGLGLVFLGTLLVAIPWEKIAKIFN